MGPWMNVLAIIVGIALARRSLPEIFTAPAPFAALAAANIFALRQTAAAGRPDGILTDVDLMQRVATASEAQLEAMFQGHVEENTRWR